MTASVASVTFNCSDSNQRSRIGRAAPVRISIASAPSLPKPAELPGRACRGSRNRRAGLDHGSGGVCTSIGSRKSATRVEHRLVLRQVLGVLRGELAHFAMGQFLVGPHHQIAAVGKRRERRRAARQHLEAVLLQFQVADDLRPQQAVDVGGRGDLEAGPDFFGDAAAADDFAAFQHQGFIALLGQIRRRDEAVVPGADDDGVVRLRHEHLILNKEAEEQWRGEQWRKRSIIAGVALPRLSFLLCSLSPRSSAPFCELFILLRIFILLRDRPQINRVLEAVGLDLDLLFGLPVIAHVEVVRHDARAGLESPLQASA